MSLLVFRLEPSCSDHVAFPLELIFAKMHSPKSPTLILDEALWRLSKSLLNFWVLFDILTCVFIYFLLNIAAESARILKVFRSKGSSLLFISIWHVAFYVWIVNKKRWTVRWRLCTDTMYKENFHPSRFWVLFQSYSSFNFCYYMQLLQRWSFIWILKHQWQKISSYKYWAIDKASFFFIF